MSRTLPLQFQFELAYHPGNLIGQVLEKQRKRKSLLSPASQSEEFISQEHQEFLRNYRNPYPEEYQREEFLARKKRAAAAAAVYRPEYELAYPPSARRNIGKRKSITSSFGTILTPENRGGYALHQPLQSRRISSEMGGDFTSRIGMPVESGPQQGGGYSAKSVAPIYKLQLPKEEEQRHQAVITMPVEEEYRYASSTFSPDTQRYAEQGDHSHQVSEQELEQTAQISVSSENEQQQIHEDRMTAVVVSVSQGQGGDPFQGEGVVEPVGESTEFGQLISIREAPNPQPPTATLDRKVGQNQRNVPQRFQRSSYTYNKEIPGFKISENHQQLTQMSPIEFRPQYGRVQNQFPRANTARYIPVPYGTQQQPGSHQIVMHPEQESIPMGAEVVYYETLPGGTIDEQVPVTMGSTVGEPFATTVLGDGSEPPRKIVYLSDPNQVGDHNMACLPFPVSASDAGYASMNSANQRVMSQNYGSTGGVVHHPSQSSYVRVPYTTQIRRTEHHQRVIQRPTNSASVGKPRITYYAVPPSDNSSYTESIKVNSATDRSRNKNVGSPQGFVRIRKQNLAPEASRNMSAPRNIQYVGKQTVVTPSGSSILVTRSPPVTPRLTSTIEGSQAGSSESSVTSLNAKANSNDSLTNNIDQSPQRIEESQVAKETPPPPEPRPPTPIPWWKTEEKTLWTKVLARLPRKELVSVGMFVCKLWQECIEGVEEVWEEIDVSGKTLNKEQFLSIARKKPRKVNLSWAGASREEVEACVKGNERLDTVSLAGCHWSSVEGLKSCSSTLLQLDLRYVHGCTDNNFKRLVMGFPRLKKLEELFVSQCDVSDATVRLIANQFPKMRKIDLSYCEKITNLSLDVMGAPGTQARHHLKELVLANCQNLTSDIFVPLSRMTALTLVNVRACPDVSEQRCTEFKNACRAMGRDVMVLF